jgi:hypothetical protein
MSQQPRPSHLFIFTPGIWLGEGTISFSYSPNQLKFYTRWEVKPMKEANKSIRCYQRVEISGVPQATENVISVFEKENNTFIIHLENDSVGVMSGDGVVSETIIRWEFKERPEYNGFEMYSMNETEERYLLNAEYNLEGKFRSIINGHIWRSTTKE